MIPSVIVYFSAFGTSLCFASLYKRAKSAIEKVLTFILLETPTVLISSIRYGIGTDYFRYLEVYNSINSRLSWNSILNFYQEPSWVIINLVANNYYQVLLFSSIIYSLFIFLSINRCKQKIGVTFPLFISYMVFYCLSFNGIRQAIAAAILLFGITFLLNKKTIKDYFLFFLFVILAATFHKSALVFSLVVFLSLFKKNKVSLVLTITAIASLGVVLLHSPINSLLSRLNLYSSYLNKESNGGIGFFLYILPVLIPCAYIIFSSKCKDRDVFLLLRIYVLQIPLQILGVYISYADRLAEYSLITQILFIPMVVKLVKPSKLNIARAYFIAWYVFYFFVMFVFLGSNGVFPYVSIWSK